MRTPVIHAPTALTITNSPLPRSLDIVVLLGGPSAEREVSLESGREIVAALRRRGHRVVAVDPGTTPPNDAAFAKLTDWSRYDLAFLALHGTFGEDGTVQRLLDRIGLPYTGSNATASALAFSKSAAKQRFLAAGVRTPESTVLHAGTCPQRPAQIAAGMGFPLVVKPDAQGSSLGVSILMQPEEFPAALAKCFDLGTVGPIRTLRARRRMDRGRSGRTHPSADVRFHATELSGLRGQVPR